MKKLLTTGALLLGCTCAHASPISWDFSYTGFFDREANTFLADEAIHGSFRGNDLNGNGLLEKGELLSLVIGGLDYIACAGGSNAHYQCGATGFSFSPEAGLQFAVGSYGSDPEGWRGGGYLITSGEQIYSYDFDPSGTRERHLMWTADTRLTMIPHAPEPTTWAMLATGLLVLGWRARRAGRLTRRPA